MATLPPGVLGRFVFTIVTRRSVNNLELKSNAVECDMISSIGSSNPGLGLNEMC